jgi:F-type H+-transporting ATPase subunit b
MELRIALERDLAAKSAEAEASIHQAKASALKEVNAVASDIAAEIVRRLIGIAPSQSEVTAAVAAVRKE